MFYFTHKLILPGSPGCLFYMLLKITNLPVWGDGEQALFAKDAADGAMPAIPPWPGPTGIEKDFNTVKALIQDMDGFPPDQQRRIISALNILEDGLAFGDG